MRQIGLVLAVGIACERNSASDFGCRRNFSLMGNVRETVSRRGYHRYTFDLSDGTQTVRVFAYGAAPCRSGAVTLEGTFEQAKRRKTANYSYDEIIALNVICLPLSRA